MATRNRQGRITQILETLRTGRTVTVQELSQQLSVSEMTIRRDLMLLASEERIRLLKAGAQIRSPSPEGKLSFYSRSSQTDAKAAEKSRIGAKAAALVEAGDVLIIDSGSTTECLARSLPPDIPLTVICFALNIFLEVGYHPARTVVFAGGILRPDTLVCESAEGIELLRRYRATKVFLSAGGVSTELGLTCMEAAEAELKRAAIRSSQSKILLVDSTKFGRITPSWFAALSEIEVVVTDAGVSLEYVEILRSLGIALHVA